LPAFISLLMFLEIEALEYPLVKGMSPSMVKGRAAKPAPLRHPIR
jgi:hypothetical protein